MVSSFQLIHPKTNQNPFQIQAKNTGEAVEIATREFDKYKNDIMELIQDPATKDKAVETVAGVVNSCIAFVQSFVKETI
jgi:hypothetical protein